MKILAIDPATSCGFAIGLRGVDKPLDHGVWNLGSHRTEGQKLAVLAEHMRAVGPVNMIAVEAASFGATPSGQGIQWSQVVWQNKMRGVIELVAAEIGAEVQAFHPSTIKSFVTGSGRATKDQVRRAVKRLLGIETVDDNDADAVSILELAKRPDCWAKTAKKAKRKVKAPRRGKKQTGMLFG